MGPWPSRSAGWSSRPIRVEALMVMRTSAPGRPEQRVQVRCPVVGAAPAAVARVPGAVARVPVVADAVPVVVDGVPGAVDEVPVESGAGAVAWAGAGGGAVVGAVGAVSAEGGSGAVA